MVAEDDSAVILGNDSFEVDMMTTGSDSQRPVSTDSQAIRNLIVSYTLSTKNCENCSILGVDLV